MQLTYQGYNATLKDEMRIGRHSSESVLFNERLAVVEGYGRAAIENLVLSSGVASSCTFVY